MSDGSEGLVEDAREAVAATCDAAPPRRRIARVAHEAIGIGVGLGTGGTPAGVAGRGGRRADEFEAMLYHITHDLRAAARPMSVVPGWIREDLASAAGGADAVVAERIEEHLRLLESHAARLDRMLVDLRTFSRIGRISDPLTRLDVGAELDAVLAQLGLPDGFEVARRIMAPSLVAPRNEFRLVLRAVIGNACKHHDRDRGRITVTTCQSGAATRLTVIDDGPGIDRRYRDQVFAMMATLRPRDDVEGSGLGLSMAQKAVARLGGSIEIADPLAPRGTCVVIVLPALPVEAAS